MMFTFTGRRLTAAAAMGDGATRSSGLRAGAVLNTVALAAALVQPAACPGQTAQAMGAVSTHDARVTGGLEVAEGVANLLNNVSVTAYDHAAPVALNRGGHVLVCSTSEFHLLHSGPNGSLIFGLDRGAVEIYSGSLPQDVVLTPDLKLTPVTRGQMDLRVRVTPEGDTCVENHGAGSPVLNATDAFSSASYRILPGQHLLFVKGDLHRVVDNERSPCGCPSGVPEMLAGNSRTSAAAAQAHPFPEAQSEGLAPTPVPANEAGVGDASSQVSTTFSYGEGQTGPPGAAPAPSLAPAATSPEQAPRQHGFGAALRRFFHRLFHPGS